MKAQKCIGLTIVALGLLGLWFLRELDPVFRLALASIGMIFVIKLAAMIWQREDNTSPDSFLSAFLFIALWPGISLSGFTQRKTEPPPETGKRFMEAWLFFLFGLVTLFLVSILTKGNSTLGNYIALVSILFIVHLGLVELAADGIRLIGYSPKSLFDQPYLATSLRDFWSHRWNRAFVDMNKTFLLKPLHKIVPPRVLVISIFLVSGCLHELGISYADGVSWGRPFLYFFLQGLGMELETRFKFSKPLLWIWILAPLPLLFTPSFVNLFLGGLATWISFHISILTKFDWLKYGLFAGGFGHLLVLCASLQVPGKLNWKQEFQKLSSLNRKVFWTYGGYIFSIIVFMSAVSFIMARDLESLASAPAKIWLLFIGIFWWARVFTDLFYMKHSDWPQGPLFTIGHICLTTLFISLAAGYTLLFFMGI